MSTIGTKAMSRNERIRHGIGEYLDQWRPWRNPLLYLLVLLAPAGIAGIILCDRLLASSMSPEDTVAFWSEFAGGLEDIGPWLLVTASTVFLAKAALLRNPTYLVVGAMAVSLMFREFHWHHFIKVAIYPLLCVCLIWAIAWHRKLDRPARNPALALLLLAAVTTYGLAQFTEKRLFRFLPNEDALHTQFEELTEITAHTLLLLASLVSSWRRRPAGASE